MAGYAVNSKRLMGHPGCGIADAGVTHPRETKTF